jgi:hypothetical protein
MRKKILLLPLSILLIAGAARAQEAQTPASAGAGTTTNASNTPPDKDKQQTNEDYTHFRFGLGLDGNYLTSSGLSGAGVGLQIRLGAQINQWFAVYYQGHGLVGGLVGGSDSTGAGVLGAAFNSAMAELTLPLVHIGAGPSVDYVGIAGCSAASGCSPDTGVHFGLDGRVALVIGGHGPGRHGGFAVNFDAHPTFLDGATLTTLSLGLGGEMY